MAADEVTKKKTQNWDEVEILGPTYEPGKPEGKDDWRSKLGTREQMLGYLRTGERYWYSDVWHGSEKRKTPA
jgi:hypothetical protein